jgi:two-component system, NarL family, nitrate/nitrite response regulator NarL
VLLCDDHELFSVTLAALLRDHGVSDVRVASRPREALLALQQARADVCVLDVCFPDASGLDAVEGLLQAAPGLRVLILTAIADAEVVERARRAGARGVTVKSEPVEVILGAINRVRRGDLVFPAPATAPAPPVSDAHRLAGYLTAREREVLEQMVQGLDTRSIALALGVSYSTARSHVQGVLVKLGVHSRLEAVAIAVRESLVDVGRPGSPRMGRGRVAASA